MDGRIRLNRDQMVPMVLGKVPRDAFLDHAEKTCNKSLMRWKRMDDDAATDASNAMFQDVLLEMAKEHSIGQSRPRGYLRLRHRQLDYLRMQVKLHLLRQTLDLPAYYDYRIAQLLYDVDALYCKVFPKSVVDFCISDSARFLKTQRFWDVISEHSEGYRYNDREAWRVAKLLGREVGPRKRDLWKVQMYRPDKKEVE